MSLDPRYIPLTTIWQLFTDKDTGNFLRDGYVKFWIDTNRTVGKPVYQLTGSPPNYTYIEYGYLDTDGSWRVDINDQGALDLIPYGFPYDEDGNIELYFIKVYSADNVEQFSREGLPNVAGAGPDNITEAPVNYVPNPQFLLHLDLPKTSTLQAGQVRSAITDMAWGGWTYERPLSSTATDFVTFDRFGSDVVIPDKSPRYSLRIECQSPSPGDTFKDVRLKFRDVNKFSSAIDSFTFSFQSQVNAGSALAASILLIKNFGTGGSSSTETILKAISIGNSWATYSVSFIFGENTNKTLGTLNDDYLQLCIRLPVDSIFDVSFDSYDLAKGTLANPTMPYTTDSQMIYRSISGFMPIPNPDGSDLYLYPRLTPTGMEFDKSEIGNIYSTVRPIPPVSYLNCDGSEYEYESYSTDKIPYKRLGDFMWNSTNNFYYFGTGTSFATTIQCEGATQHLKLTNNSPGAVANTSDGSTPTGFTFSTIKQGNTTYGFNAYRESIGVLVKILADGIPFSTPSNGTSGFSVSIVRQAIYTNSLIAIENITAAAGLAGKYFTVCNTTTNFYFWFKVDGVGTDPAIPGATGIEIDLLSVYSIAQVTQCIADALSGRQISDILCTSASTITAGAFWDFNTPTKSFYVWYEKDGSGTDPAPSGKIGIKVKILSSNTASDVSLASNIAINKKYYATPDFRGMFLRGIDNGAGVDRDVSARFNIFSNSFGNEIGTIELDDITNHAHTFQLNDNSPIAPLDLVAATGDVTGHTIHETTYSGGYESRPTNIYVNYIIKY